ncbi:MAG: segregation/condensation protein A [Clostridia bacterium]|nr:segregation/condensation protein A [Clostridia bacterium]
MEQMRFHLEYFEGPLDLLLHLIRESKIEIESVFMSDVTEQYLSYMDELDRVDIEAQAEFLAVASTLLEIKSKALLPKYEEETTETDEDANELLRRLEEYKLIKKMSESLKEIEETGKLYRPADPADFAEKVVFLESDISMLLKACNRLLMMQQEMDVREKTVQKIIPKDSTTVEEQQTKVLKVLKERGKTTFFELVKEKVSKTQLVTMLLAILDLIKNQVIKISQNGLFDDIDIEFKEN